jgi:hypothetical protein
MNFFTAYKAVDVNIPIYFIESTAPNNVDDTGKISNDPLPHLQLIPDSDDAVRQIAADLAKGNHPNLVVMVHGFNNPKPEVLKTYTAAAIAVDRDQAIRNREGLVCLGYRWPSEKMDSPGTAPGMRCRPCPPGSCISVRSSRSCRSCASTLRRIFCDISATSLPTTS